MYGCGVAVIVIVTGGGHVEENTLQVGFEDVDGASLETEVEMVVAVLEGEFVVEGGELEVDEGDGDGEAELELLLAVVVVVIV